MEAFTDESLLVAIYVKNFKNSYRLLLLTLSQLCWQMLILIGRR